MRRSQGNLLVTYGAKKRPPSNDRYHSAYTFQINDCAVLNLWGWGIWLAYSQYGSLFISRSRFRSRYSREVIPMPDAWRARDLPSMSGTRNEAETKHADHLLAMAMNWVGCYEHWLCGQVGPDYRECVVDKWPQRKRHKGNIPAAEMSTH